MTDLIDILYYEATGKVLTKEERMNLFVKTLPDEMMGDDEYQNFIDNVYTRMGEDKNGKYLVTCWHRLSRLGITIEGSRDQALELKQKALDQLWKDNKNAKQKHTKESRKTINRKVLNNGD